MCQAYEGERNYILKSEAFDRARGYRAQQEGEARNPPEHVYKDHWLIGYDLAAEGRELW